MAKKLAIGLVIVAAAAAAVYSVVNRAGNAGEPVKENIRRAEVERDDMVVSVSATGSIVPGSDARLSFDWPGKVVKVWVETGDVVEQGDELAKLDDVNLVFQVEQAKAALAAAQAQLDQLQAGARGEEIAAAEANLEAAQAGLDNANASLSELEGGADANQIAAAESNLSAADASLWLSNVQRDQIIEGVSAAEIAAAEAQVASALTQQKVARDALDATRGSNDDAEEHARYHLYAADEALAASQAQLDWLLGGPTQSQIDAGNANAAIAQAQRDAAQAQLDQLQAGASAGQLEAAKANVAAMTAQRDAAQAQLDLVRAGASVHQVAAAQASVDQAQVAVEMAQAESDKATLVAPFDGVVTAVDVQEEQLAPATLPALTLADMSELQIVVNVDEIDVARIKEGQDVRIRVDALPGEVTSGYVKRIAPAASQVGGVVVYQVTLVLDETDLALRTGMSATADITIEELEDVLQVPNWALRIDRDTGMMYVNLLQSDGVEEAEVGIGIRGEDVSQVLFGLTEDDIVVAGDAVGLGEFMGRGE